MPSNAQNILGTTLSGLSSCIKHSFKIFNYSRSGPLKVEFDICWLKALLGNKENSQKLNIIFNQKDMCFS
jgi:hypothetical protein